MLWGLDCEDQLTIEIKAFISSTLFFTMLDEFIGNKLIVINRLIKTPDIFIQRSVLCTCDFGILRALRFSFIAKIDGDTCDYNPLPFPPLYSINIAK